MPGDIHVTTGSASQWTVKHEFDPNDLATIIFNKPEDLTNDRGRGRRFVSQHKPTKKKDPYKAEEELFVASTERDLDREKSIKARSIISRRDCDTPPAPVQGYSDDDHDMEATTPVPSPPITNPEELSAAPLGTTQDQARSANNPTQKTRRGVLMEAIILRHIDSVFPGRLTRLGILHGEESTEDIDQKMEGLKNPMAKFRRGRALTHDTVRARLHTVGYDLYPIQLDKSIQDVIVQREFLSKLYGGSGVPTFPNIGATFHHGLDDFMYPNLDHNPHCPQVPGASGLFFEAEGVHAFPWPKIQRVITRIQSGWWQYQGQYRLEPSVSLTRREWASQGSKFHNTWAKEIHKKQWGKVVRAKIFLREALGREFSQAELLKAIASERSFRAEVTPDKIIRAFARGEESISVWTMKCVGYDNEFQHNIANKYPTWELQHKDSTTKKCQKQGETQKTGPKVGKNRKRVMRETISDEDGDSSTDSDVDQEGLVYSTRGTRSRPIVL